MRPAVAKNLLTKLDPLDELTVRDAHAAGRRSTAAASTTGAAEIAGEALAGPLPASARSSA
ncbi:hypothetical protein ACR6C2_42680 [Streptomyces sp. INA 01156]